MSAIVAPSRLLPFVLSAAFSLLACPPVQASAQDNTGSVLLRMCKSGDKVKMLSLMCRSYFNGHVDAAQHYGKGKTAFCLGDNDREQAPAAVVAWIEAHPESLRQPAAEVLHKALSERFPCKGRK